MLWLVLKFLWLDFWPLGNLLKHGWGMFLDTIRKMNDIAHWCIMFGWRSVVCVSVKVNAPTIFLRNSIRPEEPIWSDYHQKLLEAWQLSISFHCNLLHYKRWPFLHLHYVLHCFIELCIWSSAQLEYEVGWLSCKCLRS